MQDFDADLIKQKLESGSLTIDDIDCILSILETEKSTEIFEMFQQYTMSNKREERPPLTVSEMEQIVNQILRADH